MKKINPNINSVSLGKDSKPYVFEQQASDNPVLFEVAWEVCNQLGGIYTVIKSKAPSMYELWGENYFLIGPYFPESAEIEFEQADYKSIEDTFLANALDELKVLGMPFY